MAVDELGRMVHPGTLVDGRKTVTAAGTAEAFSSTALLVDWIIIMAETNNTGVVTVGASTVVAAVATRRGIPLSAGDVITMQAVDLLYTYIDSTVNGDGVTYLYRV